MWSNDFPHENSTWPRSRDVIARDLGDLPETARRKVLSENVAALYNISLRGLQGAAGFQSSATAQG